MTDVIWEGLAGFMEAATEVAVRVDEMGRKAVAEAASALEKKAKENAPVRRGTLRRGIIQDPISRQAFAGYMTKVYPTIVYSRRIELGFHGPDSLGRMYNQVGHPYFAPAFHSIDFKAIFHRRWTEAIVG